MVSILTAGKNKDTFGKDNNMQCIYCGNEINDNSRFCPKCGKELKPKVNSCL